MLSVHYYTVLFVTAFVGYTNGCNSPPIITYNHWIESNDLFDYIRISGPSSSSLAQLHSTIEDQLKFRTEFFYCGLVWYMRTSVFTGVTRYLYNDNSGSPVDISLDDDLSPGPDNGHFFKYENPFFFWGYTSLGSEVSHEGMKYIKRRGATPSLKFVNAPYYWMTMPYATSGGGSRGMTQIISSLIFNNRNLAVAIFVKRRKKLSARTFTGQPPNSGKYRFEALSYRYYKGVSRNGTLIISHAIVLRHANTESYIAVRIDNNGQINLPFRVGGTSSRPAEEPVTSAVVATTAAPAAARASSSAARASSSAAAGHSVGYNKADLVDYQGRNGTFLHPSDIGDQNVVDERFFEVIPQSTQGTYKLVSTHHPDRYLAVIRRGRRATLVIAQLSTLPATVINYDFSLNIPANPPSTVRRLPDFPQCNLTPKDMYTVNGLSCRDN